MPQEQQKFLRIPVTSAIGDTDAEKALQAVVKEVESQEQSDQGVVVVFDLSDIEFATTSFIKGCILAVFQSGKLSTDPSNIAAFNAFGVPAMNVFPVIANANEELSSLVDEIFGRRNLPMIAIQLDKKGKNLGGRLLGRLDDALLRTMRTWKAKSPVTAADLKETFGDEGISQTAWSNRLNDLWRLRLLLRRRKGKSWLYQPVMEEINYG